MSGPGVLACPDVAEVLSRLPETPDSSLSSSGATLSGGRTLLEADPAAPVGSYLGVDVPHEPIARIRSQIESTTGLVLAHRGEAHITAIAPVELGRLLKLFPEASRPEVVRQINRWAVEDNIAGEGFRIEGVGRAADPRRAGREAFYLVVHSDAINRFRSGLGSRLAAWADAHAIESVAAKIRAERILPDPFDAHITVGYVGSDVFGVPKDSSTLDSRFEIAGTIPSQGGASEPALRLLPGRTVGSTIQGQGDTRIRARVEQTTTRASELQLADGPSGRFSPADIDFESARAHLRIHEAGSEIAGSQFTIGADEVEALIRNGLPQTVTYDAHQRAEITLSLVDANGSPRIVGRDLMRSEADLRALAARHPEVLIFEGQRTPGGEPATLAIDGQEVRGAWHTRPNGMRVFEPDALLADIPPTVAESLTTNRITVIIQRDPQTNRPRVLTAFPGDNTPSYPGVWRDPSGATVLDSTRGGSLESRFWRERGSSRHGFVRVVSEVASRPPSRSPQAHSSPQPGRRPAGGAEQRGGGRRPEEGRRSPPAEVPRIVAISEVLPVVAAERRSIKVAGVGAMEVNLVQTSSVTASVGLSPQVFHPEDLVFSESAAATSEFSRPTSEMERIVREALPDVIHFDTNNRAELTLEFTRGGRPVPMGLMGIVTEADLARLYPAARIRDEAMVSGGTRGVVNGRAGTFHDISRGDRSGRRFAPDRRVVDIPRDQYRQNFSTNRVTVIIQRVEVKDQSGRVTGYRPRVLLLGAGDPAPRFPVQDHWPATARDPAVSFDTLSSESLESRFWDCEGCYVTVRPRDGAFVAEGRPPRVEATPRIQPELSAASTARRRPSGSISSPVSVPTSRAWTSAGAEFFTASVAPSPRSLAARPAVERLFQELGEVQAQINRELREMTARGESPAVIVRRARDLVSRDLAQRIFRRAQEIPASTVDPGLAMLRETLRLAGQKIQSQGEWWAGRIAEAERLGERFDFTQPNHRRSFSILTSGAIGQAGELQTFLRLPDPSGPPGFENEALISVARAHGSTLTSVEDLATRLRNADAALSPAEAKAIATSEVDLMFVGASGHLAMGEVKNYSTPLNPTHERFEEVAHQLEARARMIRAFGIDTELHIFLPAGISPDGVLALQRRVPGVLIHGPRVTPRSQIRKISRQPLEVWSLLFRGTGHHTPRDLINGFIIDHRVLVS